MDTKKQQRKFGFPIMMSIGFGIGACVATVVAFVLAAGAPRFSYTMLFDLVLCLGILGTYLGHVIGALWDKEAGFKPLGPLSLGVYLTGMAIVFIGTIIVVAAVAAIRWGN